MTTILRIHRVLLGAGLALAFGAQAQPSVEDLKRQLAPPKMSDEDRYAALAGADEGMASRGLATPGANGSCDADAMRRLDAMERQPSASHRNLEVVPAEPATSPQATMDLQFGYASYKLSAADKAQLDRLAQALNSPELKRSQYAIRGHTDSSGDKVKNLRLSCGRALEAKQYLVDVGRVDGSRLAAFGFGSLRPIKPGDATDGANRRVEIRWVR